MLNRAYGFLIALLASGVLSAQGVSGTVISVPDSVHLVGVNVTIENSNRSTTTDWYGHFYFDSLAPGTHRIILSYQDYHDTTFAFSIDSNVRNSVVLFPIVLICKYDRSEELHDCPYCKKSDEVIPIVYGYPGKETLKKSEQGKLMMGGCMVTGCDPWWYCKRCKKNH